MAWIKEQSRTKNEKLNSIYQDVEKLTGKDVDNVLKVHSVNPDVLELHIMLYRRVLHGQSELSRTEREMIGVVVSKSNQCSYCTSHHSRSLYFVSKNKKLMKEIAINYLEANLEPKHYNMCKYVEKLTKTPYKMVEDDVVELRNVGYSEQAIFDINQVCAYFNYVNRIVDGLGVDLE